MRLRRRNLIAAAVILVSLIAALMPVAAASAAEAHMKKASELVAADVDGAIAELKLAIAADKGYVPAYLALANIYVGAKRDLQTALDYCSQAEKIAPKDPQVYMTRGVILFTGGGKERLPEAIAQFRKVTELAPNSADGHWALGRSLLLNGEKTEGAAECDKAIALAPDNVIWLVEHGQICVGLEQQAKAEKLFKQAVAKNTRFLPAHMNLALLYLTQGKYDNAIASYKDAMALSPNDPGIMTDLGTAYLKKKDYAMAIGCYRQAIAINARFGGAWYNLACAYSLQKKVTEAVDALRTAIGIDARFKEMAKQDKDFDAIRNEAAFKALVG